ncbi:hypothetical protein SDC9_205420 [bioreactor metagenome]|uniref:4-hydroxy-2-oxoglutarate aldolase n=1 Tax=bioreactor metagenome TaxID=1076179 RepID=A0A645J2R6_9ZZZZ
MDQYSAALGKVAKYAVLCAACHGLEGSGYIGELMTAAAMSSGAVGTINDGGIRDIGGIIELGFPTFAKYITPTSAYGTMRIYDYEKPIRFGGLDVAPGDVVVADNDGIVIIPSSIAEAVIEKVLEKLN